VSNVCRLHEDVRTANNGIIVYRNINAFNKELRRPASLWRVTVWSWRGQLLACTAAGLCTGHSLARRQCALVTGYASIVRRSVFWGHYCNAAYIRHALSSRTTEEADIPANSRQLRLWREKLGTISTHKSCVWASLAHSRENRVEYWHIVARCCRKWGEPCRRRTYVCKQDWCERMYHCLTASNSVPVSHRASPAPI